MLRATRSFLEKQMIKHGETLLLGYMIVGCIPLLIFRLELDTAFDFAFKYLAVPILIASFFCYFFVLNEWRQTQGNIKGTFSALMIAGVLVSMSSGYVVAVNAYFGEQTKIEVRGEIVELYYTRGTGFITYHAAVSSNDGVVRHLEIPEVIYHDVEVGREYHQLWIQGSLGLLYKPN